MILQETKASAAAAQKIADMVRAHVLLIARLTVFLRDYGYILDQQIRAMFDEDVAREASYCRQGKPKSEAEVLARRANATRSIQAGSGR